MLMENYPPDGVTRSQFVREWPKTRDSGLGSMMVIIPIGGTEVFEMPETRDSTVGKEVFTNGNF